jgi:hypothetical protein
MAKNLSKTSDHTTIPGICELNITEHTAALPDGTCSEYQRASEGNAASLDILLATAEAIADAVPVDGDRAEEEASAADDDEEPTTAEAPLPDGTASEEQ